MGACVTGPAFGSAGRGNTSGGTGDRLCGAFARGEAYELGGSGDVLGLRRGTTKGLNRVFQVRPAQDISYELTLPRVDMQRRWRTVGRSVIAVRVRERRWVLGHD
jgi:hypothetical protein